jgi:hypothetical protein
LTIAETIKQCIDLYFYEILWRYILANMVWWFYLIPQGEKENYVLFLISFFYVCAFASITAWLIRDKDYMCGRFLFSGFILPQYSMNTTFRHCFYLSFYLIECLHLNQLHQLILGIDVHHQQNLLIQDK